MLIIQRGHRGGYLKYEHVILGRQHGIALVKRGPTDPHVSLVLLSEDDDNWFTSTDNQFSSHWVPDLIDVMFRAQQWMEQYCDPDSEGFGYTFRN